MKRKASESLCPACNGQLPMSSNEAANVSWTRCDACRQWFHNMCLSLSGTELAKLALFHCSACEEDHGPSPIKRQLKRARAKIDYVALDQGETFAVDKSVHPHVTSFMAFDPTVDLSTKLSAQSFVDVLESSALTKSYVLASGLPRPAVMHGVTGESGLELPRSRDQITVEYVANATGADEPVEVMDVLSQQSELPLWCLRQWKDYFYTPETERDRIRNVISLEVSQVDGLGNKFRRPHMVSDLDLVDKVWCDTDGRGQQRPQVTVYCLMSVKGSYTDFHIDFSGTPVYYTVCHGSKTFLMYPPTPENLALYESWCHEPQQNFTWFGDYSKRINGKKVCPTNGFKVSLSPGDLFIIPSGWIHAVYTPEDAVILGGNYLTLRDLPMHLAIYEIERRTRVPAKYRFPMFNKVLWLTSWYYYNHQDEFLLDLGCTKTQNGETGGASQASECNEESQLVGLQGKLKSESDAYVAENSLDLLPSEHAEQDSSVKPKNNGGSVADTVAAKSHNLCKSGPSVTLSQPQRADPHQVLQSLINHLKHHYETSKTQPMAKKSIPTQLIGRNVNAYFEKLEVWLRSLEHIC